MIVGVLSLQGDFQEHLSVLGKLGVETRSVKVPEDLKGLDALVLPGGESTTISMLIRSSGLEAPLRDRSKAAFPLFGTCAGLILLATHITDGRSDQIALGALDLVVRRNGFGRQLKSFEADLDVKGLSDGPMRAVFIRAPVVETVRADVEVLAEVEFEFEFEEAKKIPVVLRSESTLACSFHPELTGDFRLHQMFLDIVNKS